MARPRAVPRRSGGLPRLLHIITGLGTGGAERSLANLLAGGLAARFECRVVSLGGAGRFGPEIAALGVPVDALEMRAGLPGPSGALRLRRLVRDFRPDIVQGWMYHGNAAALFARAVAPGRPKMAWSIRQSLYDLAEEKRGTRAVIRFCAWRSGGADAIVYNSRTARRHHEAQGYAAGHAAIVPNGFDTGLWRPDAGRRAALRADLGIGEGDRAVGFAARYHKMKDLPAFLNAMARLMPRDPGLHAVIAGPGTGPENPALSAHYAGLPQSRVHCLGQRDDMSAIFAGLDIFCLSSWNEAFPNVVGEAMATAVPCVVTDVGDAAHVVGDTGRIVPRRDPGALAAALAEMLALSGEDRRALGERARRRIVEKFALARTVERYARLMDGLMDGSGACADQRDSGPAPGTATRRGWCAGWRRGSPIAARIPSASGSTRMPGSRSATGGFRSSTSRPPGTSRCKAATGAT